MKKPLLALFLSFSVAGCGEKTMNVLDFVKNPTPIEKKVSLVGIVAPVRANDAKVFALQDVREATCKSKGCENVLLPVRYEGEMPRPGETVTVAGTLDLSKNCFVAAKVRKLKL
jgi:hypothetical protein